MISDVAGRLGRAIAFLGLFLVTAQAAWAARVERVVSPAGVEAWLVEDKLNPIISVEVALRGGAAQDPAGKEGLAQMAADLLDEGAGALDSQAFLAKLEDLAIHLNFSAGRDTLRVRLKTLSENRQAAFEMLGLALNDPRFDLEPVERIRSQRLADLRQASESPDHIASESLMAALFPGHPYGRPADGVMESIKAITAEDLRDFTQRRFGRDRLVVAVVGDITAADLRPLLDSAFGRLREKAEAQAIPEIRASDSGRLKVIRKPLPQSVVAFAQPGIKRDDPDWFAAYVANYILGGGGFSSRLTNEVREKRGLAYSVYSYLLPLERSGLIYGGVATENARVGQSLDLIRAEWRRLAEQGVTDKELENAKTYLTGSFVLQLDTTQNVAGILAAMQLDRLGIDFLDKRNELVKAVTAADVRRVAKRLFDAKALSIVVVGDPQGLNASD